jgi:hypothetical protein
VVLSGGDDVGGTFRACDGYREGAGVRDVAAWDSNVSAVYGVSWVYREGDDRQAMTANGGGEKAVFRIFL